MKKLLVSGLFLYPEQVGGAENYFNNLLNGFVQNAAEREISLILNDTVQDGFSPDIRHFDTHYIKIKRNRAVYDLMLPKYAHQFYPYEVFFLPNYQTPLPLFSRKNRYITTIHDLQYLHFPQFFSFARRNWQYWSHQNTLRNAHTVVCISDFVKEDIIARFGEKFRKKLVVIHNPIAFDRFEQSIPSNRFKFDYPYILSVAAHYPHKNILCLVKAFQIFNKKHPEVRLVLAGQLSQNLKGGNYEAYGAALHTETQKNPNIIITGYIPDDELSWLYQKCMFFAFPSLFEGFGMPPVEAMALGKPVIVSNCTALAEVTLNKALYIRDPHNEHEIADLLTDCYTNLTYYTQQAYNNVPEIRTHYHPKAIAEAYLDVFAQYR
jgi:glycosyltransferase involved in cell wall biosynthesis